jgi:hypothetical protein
MVQQSDGIGGLGPAFLIGESNVNPNDYYLKTTTLNNITAPDGDLSLADYQITNLGDATGPKDALNR